MNVLDPLFTTKFEDEILELIAKRDEFTQSDLQAVVTALVNKIMRQGYWIYKAEDFNKRKNN